MLKFCIQNVPMDEHNKILLLTIHFYKSEKKALHNYIINITNIIVDQIVLIII